MAPCPCGRRAEPNVRFQDKLLLTYTVLIVLLTVVLAILFYGYSARVFERNAVETYELLTAKLSQQLDNVIRPMDFISTNLISDAGFKSSLALLGSVDRKDSRNAYLVTEAANSIKRLLSSYSIIKNFYAVVVFNLKGDFFSSNFLGHAERLSSLPEAEGLPWLVSAAEAAGRAVAVAPYEDRWQSAEPVQVFGRARVIPGIDEDLGFIEVQNRSEDLQEVLAIPDARFVRILVAQPSGETLFRSEGVTDAQYAYYLSRIEEAKGRPTGFVRNSLTGEFEAISATTSEYSGLTTALVLNKRILLSPLRFIRTITLGIGVVIILFSVAYNWVSSKQLVRPLKLIKERMERTELSNLPYGQPLDHPNDEIVSLDQAYRSLTARLDEAIKRELDSRTLWMRARLDSLQAQVNPHFINNVLTVIASRGLESGDERIGEICDGVASMLRYSTSTEERSATVAQELEHVETYLFLMKQRLEDRLAYRIDADPAALGARVPKIVFQQIAENSLTHGYRATVKPISVAIRAVVEGDRWVVEISDDGEGFSPDRLSELEERIAGAERSLRAGTDGTGLGIGGLGLVNTYSRLFLFYRGDFLWRIGNRKEGGAVVALGGPLAGEGGDADGSDR